MQKSDIFYRLGNDSIYTTKKRASEIASLRKLKTT